MSVREAIETRRSVRKYKKTSVEKDKVEMILDSARLAPTGHNTQPGRYMVVDDPDQIERIAAACNHQSFVAHAPLLIVLLADLAGRVKDAQLDTEVMDPVYSEQREKVIRDTAIAGSFLMLQAHDLGLGICWVGDYEQIPMRKALNSPASHYILGIFAIGYPDEEPAARPRKPLESMLSFQSYGKQDRS